MSVASIVTDAIKPDLRLPPAQLRPPAPLRPSEIIPSRPLSTDPPVSYITIFYHIDIKHLPAFSLKARKGNRSLHPQHNPGHPKPHLQVQSYLIKQRMSRSPRMRTRTKINQLCLARLYKGAILLARQPWGAPVPHGQGLGHVLALNPSGNTLLNRKAPQIAMPRRT